MPCPPEVARDHVHRGPQVLVQARLEQQATVLAGEVGQQRQPPTYDDQADRDADHQLDHRDAGSAAPATEE
jgi:hypothetical protein